MAATKPKTQAERLEAARAEAASKLDWQAQMQAVYDAERAEREKEHADFMKRVEANRDALAQGKVLEPPVIPTIQQLYQAAADADAKAAEEAERQRIASLDPRSVLLSALPVAKREFVAKWESTNKGQQFPIEALPFL